MLSEPQQNGYHDHIAGIVVVSAGKGKYYLAYYQPSLSETEDLIVL